METWKKINGYKAYEISNKGRFRSYKNNKWGLNDKPRIVNGKIAVNGYRMIVLCKDGDEKYKNIHRLVAKYFIPNPENKPCVNHKDGDKLNNHIDNLEWVTYSENSKHACDTGLLKPPTPLKGEESTHSKLTEKDVLNIRKEYKTGNISQYKLADKYNVDRSNIGYIVNRITWKHI